MTLDDGRPISARTSIPPGGAIRRSCAARTLGRAQPRGRVDGRAHVFIRCNRTGAGRPRAALAQPLDAHFLWSHPGVRLLRLGMPDALDPLRGHKSAFRAFGLAPSGLRAVKSVQIAPPQRRQPRLLLDQALSEEAFDQRGRMVAAMMRSAIAPRACLPGLRPTHDLQATRSKVG
jgi:hypothetical protein